RARPGGRVRPRVPGGAGAHQGGGGGLTGLTIRRGRARAPKHFEPAARRALPAFVFHSSDCWSVVRLCMIRATSALALRGLPAPPRRRCTPASPSDLE